MNKGFFIFLIVIFWGHFGYSQSSPNEVRLQDYFKIAYPALHPESTANESFNDFLKKSKDISSSNPQFRCRYPYLTKLIDNGSSARIESCDLLLPVNTNSFSGNKISREDLKHIKSISYFYVGPGAEAASLFGHSIIQIDFCKTPYKLKSNCSTKKVLYSFYADIPLAENSVAKMGRGLSSRYPVKIYANDLYSVLDNYTNVENRSVWSYRLALSNDDLENFALIISEFSQNYDGQKYNFLTQNCSTEVHKLFKLALPQYLPQDLEKLQTPYHLASLVGKFSNHRDYFEQAMSKSFYKKLRALRSVENPQHLQAGFSHKYDFGSPSARFKFYSQYFNDQNRSPLALEEIYKAESSIKKITLKNFQMHFLAYLKLKDKNFYDKLLNYLKDTKSQDTHISLNALKKGSSTQNLDIDLLEKYRDSYTQTFGSYYKSEIDGIEKNLKDLPQL